MLAIPRRPCIYPNVSSFPLCLFSCHRSICSIGTLCLVGAQIRSCFFGSGSGCRIIPFRNGLPMGKQLAQFVRRLRFTLPAVHRVPCTGACLFIFNVIIIFNVIPTVNIPYHSITS
ncbi:hypothetical protein D3C81_1567300 [compost metagenome]